MNRKNKKQTIKNEIMPAMISIGRLSDRSDLKERNNNNIRK